MDKDKEISVNAASSGSDLQHSPTSPTAKHGTPHEISQTERDPTLTTDPSASSPRRRQPWLTRLSYLRTKEFWLVLLLGQILALCITGTNTLTTLLVNAGTSIPAFQTLFNYVLLFLIYTPYTIYKYGFKGWTQMLLTRGWKYLILSFLDVEGNYFTVLAYRYTTILSAQLINFWAIVIVVLISFFFLHVRYHPAQLLGIVVCIGGMGLLLASDHITGSNGGDIPRSSQLKGDLFALLGATFYGLSNVAEEFFVSTRPLYEVIGQLGMYGIIINGVQAAIFDRASFRTATWSSAVGGYLTGYTLILSLFYTLVPILYRLASAAFFNISLLTGNFWGVIIGIRVFGLSVHWMYPIAFTLIMVGHFVYYLGKGVLGEAKKAWLGEGQERGIEGVGTARRKIVGEGGNATRGVGSVGEVGVERPGMHGRLEAESAGIV
ncbi:MAG: hypothetical protein Q9160_001305 [Pyrenula sp. 1 TL-2023]